MTHPPTRRRWAVRLAAGYLAVAAVAWAALWLLGDAWGPATLLLFGPRWVLAAPLPALAGVAARGRSPAAAGLLALAAVVIAGPVCGGTVSLPAGDTRGAIRVLTCNLQGPLARPAAVRQLVDDTRPTVVVCQEAPPDPAALLPAGFQFATAHNLLVAARHPVRRLDDLSGGDLGLPGAAGRFVVDAPGGELVVVNLHLPTPRPALELALHRPAAGLAELATLTVARDQAAAVARRWAGPPDPVTVLAGDFNTPPEGRIYDRHWADFQNAFSAAGTGWGATKRTSWHGVRIDHILTHPGWTCRRAWVGPDVGSDHRPLLADFDLLAD